MNAIRSDFPLLQTTLNEYPLVYLDNAATTQKPKVVLDTLYQFYAQEYASVGRGLYALAENATARYEAARATAAAFIGAQPQDIVFTSGSTHGMNMLAHGWGNAHIKAGDEIILAEWEHHSTLLPWQHLAAEKKAKIVYIPVFPDGALDYASYEELLNARTKVVVISHVSNVFGTTIAIERIAQQAKAVGAHFFLDAAQSVPHGMVNVQDITVDALVFSGHKMCGPTGIGVLYLNGALQKSMPAYHLGGGMVYEASFTSSSWRPAPHRFEAGTPPFVQAIGLAAAMTYLTQKVNFKQMRAQEAELCSRLIKGLALMPRAQVHGPRTQLQQQGHLVSFSLSGVPAHDAAALLGAHGICVRAGNLCAQPLAKKLGLEGLIRASFYIYNTADDVDLLLQGIEEVLRVL